MKKIVLAAAVLAASFVAPALQAAEERKARVATGAQVTLVKSAQTPAQWMAQRPKVRALRPRARSTLE